MEEDKYIKKWLLEELSEQELSNFRKSSDFQSLMRLDRALMAFKSPEYSVEEELVKSNSRKAASEYKHSRAKSWMKIAATLLLLATMVYIFIPKTESVIIQVFAETTKSILLPDSSQVKLKKGSMLSFDQGKWNSERKVTLDGEGYFEVKKGSRFEVVTTQGSINVLGTAFNVRAWEGYFAVDCYHGKVAVKKNKKEAVLTANQGLQFIDGSGGEIRIFEPKLPDWMLGESTFEGVPLKIVLKAFERQYEVTVTAKSINTNQSFSGSFTHADIDLALRSITVPLNLYYKINDSEVTLMSESPN
ncbi:FecR domain-containing protein [Ekhidna sp.]|uniref:FecR family protein n=1 Tax=Ekhidna sp. TaxID=2608089 RepID=UPI0032EF42F3